MSRFTLSPRAAVILAAVVVAVALVVVVLGARGSGAAGTVSVSGAAGVSAAPTAPPTTEPGAGSGSPAPSASPAPVVVHVVGAVGRAGLVTLPGGSRVADALDAAGGAGPDADLARVNLARAVVDGERLYVPRTGRPRSRRPWTGAAVLVPVPVPVGRLRARAVRRLPVPVVGRATSST